MAAKEILLMLWLVAVIGLGEAVIGSYKRECHCDANSSVETPDQKAIDKVTKGVCSKIGGENAFDEENQRSICYHTDFKTHNYRAVNDGCENANHVAICGVHFVPDD